MKIRAFTMAEVLITLGIIGIVAAMTLPSIMTNYQKKVIATKLKKTYSILNQAFMQSQQVNGDFDTWPIGEEIEDVDKYFNFYYKPYFNGVQICKNAKKCGYKSNLPWQNLSGKSVNWGLITDTTRVFFILNDGTTVFIPRNSTHSSGEPAYVNYLLMYVDVNGYKSPNVLGKDVFQFVMDKNNTIKPMCYNKTLDYIKTHCAKNGDIDLSTNCCTALIMYDGWEIKKDYPW